MGCDELRGKWPYVKLHERRHNLFSPILPPEGVMLNVAMQKGRWSDYGITMTVNASCPSIKGNQMAVFFRDFIVVIDAGADEKRYFGSGTVDAIIPFSSIREYKIVKEKIGEDVEIYYLLFTMKKDKQQFSIRLYDKRVKDNSDNYPWDYTPSTYGRKIEFYRDAVDACMSGAINYGKRALTVLEIMAENGESFSYEEFREHVTDTEDHHWSYALKFLRQMRDRGHKEYTEIYDRFKSEQKKSYDVGIENNKKIKAIIAQIEQVQEEIRLLEEEIPKLGLFAKSLKGEKLNRLEELDQMEPGLIKQQDALREEIEKSHDEIEVIKKRTLDLLYRQIVENKGYEIRIVESLLKTTGQLTYEDIALMMDIFYWLEQEHTEEDVRKMLIPLFEKDIIIIEEDKCYYKGFLDNTASDSAESGEEGETDDQFGQHKTEICDVIEQELIKKRVIREVIFNKLLEKTMKEYIGFVSEYFATQILNELVESGIVKKINTLYVSLK